MHPEWRAGSFGGNAGECVQDVGIGPTSGWGEEWSGNTCIFGGSKVSRTIVTSIIFLGYAFRRLQR